MSSQQYPSPSQGTPMEPYFLHPFPRQKNPAGNVPRRTSKLIANILVPGYPAEARELYEEWASGAEPSAPQSPQNATQLQPLGDLITNAPPQLGEVKVPKKWAKYPPKSVGRTADGTATRPRKKPVKQACNRCSKDHQPCNVRAYVGGYDDCDRCGLTLQVRCVLDASKRSKGASKKSKGASEKSKGASGKSKGTSKKSKSASTKSKGAGRKSKGANKKSKLPKSGSAPSKGKEEE